ncbi:hypothetical protein FJY71_09930, partial [candidate division WOR-3 bacterium]|nr:hypothetical protein [candidate division WOR-3 bacterium]
MKSKPATIQTALAALFLAACLTGPASALMQQNAYPETEQYATGRIMHRVQQGGETFSKHNADLMFGKDPPDDKWQGFFKFDL